ncbi:protein YnhH [Citrobacter amalonaticus]|uniref:protein YnhH n=1 Tax=Citrobacter amalonaticus TaxID=35703 RepID=UPI0040430579
MRDNCHLNGFSTLYCKTQRLKITPSRWAETRAHIPLHALSMSPILRVRHHNFRNTTGLASWPCAHEASFPYPSQLKD